MTKLEEEGTVTLRDGTVLGGLEFITLFAELFNSEEIELKEKENTE